MTEIDDTRLDRAKKVPYLYGGKLNDFEFVPDMLLSAPESMRVVVQNLQQSNGLR